jgi:hypothetical protein
MTCPVLLIEPVIGSGSRPTVRRVERSLNMTDPAKPKGGSLEAPKDRLLRMRNEEFARMMQRGQLPRIAAIDAALAALEEAPTEWQPASRAVVSDDGQTTIRMTLYAETGAVAAVELDPIRAITLAGKLIEAVLPRLSKK